MGGPILEERKNSTTQTTARKEFLILWWCGCNDVLSEETNTKDYQSSLLAVCFQTLVLLKVGGGLGNVEGWSRLVVSNFCIGRKTGVHIFGWIRERLNRNVSKNRTLTRCFILCAGQGKSCECAACRVEGIYFTSCNNTKQNRASRRKISKLHTLTDTHLKK